MKPKTLTPDLDSITTMKACRVCLARNVKMYHMSKHKLIIMYERVTGVEINSEDKLPKMLCWECAARLSSANNFREKAIKTHGILSNKISSSRFITVDDIESIDKAQYQLESTLGFKYYKGNEPNLHIIKESDIATECHKETTVMLTDNCFDDSKPEFYETNLDCKIIQNIKIELEEINEVAPIKIEYFDPNNELNVEDFQIPNPVMKITENLSREEMTNDNLCNDTVKCEENYLVIETEACEKISWKRKHASETRLRRSEESPHCKELQVVLEDISKQDSFKQVTEDAEGAKDIETLCYRRIKKESLIDVKIDFMETVSDSQDTYMKPRYEHLDISVPGNSGIDLKHNDAKSLKKPFICDVCDKRFSNKKTMKQHACDESKLLSCTYCSFKAYRKLQLKFHINSKHTKTISFICDYCGYVSYRKDYLAIHIKSKHSKRVYYNCTYCKYKATRKYILKEHINNKHTRNISSSSTSKIIKKNCVSKKHNKFFICPLCNFETTRQFALREHIHIEHTKSLSFKCEYCPYRTHNRYCLKNHVKNKHTTKKEYFHCSYCDYKAQHKHRLAEHINSQHTKATSYECTYCSFQTYHRTSLTCHINAKHTKTDSYKCSDCSFKTFHKYKYTQHIKLKHPEKD